MSTQVKSTNLVFVNGQRYRPGEVFEVPESFPLAPGMTRLTTSTQKVARKSTPKRKRQSDGPDTFSDITKEDAALGLGTE